MDSIQEKLKELTATWSMKRWVATGAIVVIAIFFAAFSLTFNTKEPLAAKGGTMLNPSQAGIEKTDTSVQPDSGEKRRNEAKKGSESGVITVDVKGAVARPGVYEVNNQERVGEIIVEAGGFTQDADQNQVNLAKKVEDQEVIYVPVVGEDLGDNLLAQQNASGPSTPTSTASGGKDGVVNLNQADQSQLMTLSGIGEKKAKDILAYREEKGGFKTIEELKEVSGIGEKTFDRLKDFITVN